VKSHTAKLVMQVEQRMDFVNITRDVEAELARSGIREGLCLVNAMHITASVFINDDEPGLLRDYRRWLEELAPSTRRPSATTTTGPVRTTPTPITSDRSWAARSWWR